MKVVTLAMLEALCADWGAPTPGAAARAVKHKAEAYYAERQAFDLSAWIAARLSDARERNWNEGRKWILPVCPFNDQHDRGEAFIVQLHSGAVSAGCQHESCVWGWKDLRGKLEPEYAERRERAEHGASAGNGASRKTTDRQPPPEVLYEDPRFASQSAEIDAFADRDREPTAPPKPAAPRWKRAPELVDEIWARKDDPWVSLRLVDDELCRVRAGGIAVVIGGPASGKSSLVSNLLLRHAREVGPAIALSIELPADELGARIVGIKCDASWEDALRGEVPREHMVDALNLPRLYVLEREKATIANFEACIDAAMAEYPGQPILAAIDYAQLLDSKEREVRQRVSDAFAQIDRASRDKRVVTIAVSQMGRAGAKAARSGEMIGTDASELGAESAAIERFATVTLTIGQKGEPREDGSQAVELSLGKGRMTVGDKVYPMTFWGRSGLWRVAGDAEPAAKVREKRDEKRETDKQRAIEQQIVGAAHKSEHPMSRNKLADLVVGNRAKTMKMISQMVASGDLVEVNRRAPNSRSFLIWTRDRVNATPGCELVSDTPLWNNQ